MSFFIQDLHLNFHSFLGFQRGSDSSDKVIMRLLPLAIGLKCFWFLIALLLYLKSTILGLSFLDLEIFAYQTSFQEDLDKSFLSRYQYEHFLASIFCKGSLALLNRIQPILERLSENITKPWKPSIIDKSNKWC